MPLDVRRILPPESTEAIFHPRTPFPRQVFFLKLRTSSSSNLHQQIRKLKPSSRVSYQHPLAMHLMYTLDANGKRLYTLKKVATGEVTKSAHPARFSPDDKYSRYVPPPPSLLPLSSGCKITPHMLEEVI
ncbi:MAG: hypothetical protein LQ346_003102 [Caloplaca aetnensis]|nr:MAG: hypothetical protein LQ346_003102 [Caloplaca aetnensis]